MTLSSWTWISTYTHWSPTGSEKQKKYISSVSKEESPLQNNNNNNKQKNFNQTTLYNENVASFFFFFQWNTLLASYLSFVYVLVMQDLARVDFPWRGHF